MAARKARAARRRGEELDGVGKKIGHKINSIQPAECSLLLGSNISRRSPLRGRVGSFSRGGRNNGTLYRAPGAQSQHPYIIIHAGKKSRGHLCRALRLGDGGTFEAPRVFRIKYFSKSIERLRLVRVSKLQRFAKLHFRKPRLFSVAKTIATFHIRRTTV